METVTILRDLWHKRLLVLVAFALAVLIGIALAYRISFPPKLESRSYHVGVATARILIDTPSSQVVEVAPKGSDTLGTRAGLIASLMVDGTIKASIAYRAGLQPSQFDAISNSAAENTAADTKPKARSYGLTTTVVTNATGDELPIIEVGTQGPTATGAARLAEAAVTGLRDYLNSKAALQKVPDAKRLQVTGLGAPQARDVVRGLRKLIVLVATLFVFLLACGAIVLVSKLASAWHAASEDDKARDLGVDEPLHALRARVDDDPFRDRARDRGDVVAVREAPSRWR